MELTLSTPALLFPAVSLLLLAYTNRFLALAALIRDLQSKYRDTHDRLLMGQIDNLRRRVILIRSMQTAGVASLFLCVFCMFLLFAGFILLGKLIFGLSLILLMVSLGLSVREIQMSVTALNLQLSDLEEERRQGGR
ncbi:hypothetical protein J2T57_003531 [Natronocella acetinitrilica]|uniref:DUF2721 domain-containing protein n=1 Tax=Natronocella acetinitrilica TaxID=414046 RepID=A0AAE3KC21_9GAMM|nr:DUF2721 domain-containing protein [Natronocella acetinitrilica]MCP1676370.1 hypothetical protein [Natronocella acetinitrilica]